MDSRHDKPAHGGYPAPTAPTAAPADLLAAVLVGQRMRALQKEYFKTRSRDVLIASKEAEREFDRLVAAAFGKAGGAAGAPRAHGGVPGALDWARQAAESRSTECSVLVATEVGHLNTLLREVERLQAALKRAHQDLRDEQREAQHAAASAYSEGRHEGLSEGRGY